MELPASAPFLIPTLQPKAPGRALDSQGNLEADEGAADLVRVHQLEKSA